MYDRTVPSYIAMVDIIIFIRKAQYKISIIVLKKIGTPQQQQGQQLEAHRDVWI